jgi:hypothetical protein
MAAVVILFVLAVAWMIISSGGADSGPSWHDTIRTLAENHGLQVGKDPDGEARGAINGKRLVVDRWTDKSGSTTTHYTRIQLQDCFPKDFTLSEAGFFETIFSGPDIKVGDRDFDDKYQIRCPSEAEAVAVLGHQARYAIRAHPDLAITEGDVIWEVSERVHDAERLGQVIESLAQFREATRLPGSDTAESLVHGAIHDKEPSYRRRALHLLQDVGSASQKQTAATAMLGDAEVGLRIQAAMYLRTPEARALLTMVASDPGNHDHHRGDALGKLIAGFGDWAGLDDFVFSLLKAPGLLGELAEAVFRAARNRALTVETAVLSQHLEHHTGDTFRLVSECAVIANDRALTTSLIDQLERDEADDRVAALNALAKLGTVNEVGALEPYTRGILSSGRVKEAARSAIAAIQSRITGADAGQLSLADAAQAGGELSVPMGQDGELSDL